MEAEKVPENKSLQEEKVEEEGAIAEEKEAEKEENPIRVEANIVLLPTPDLNVLDSSAEAGCSTSGLNKRLQEIADDQEVEELMNRSASSISSDEIERHANDSDISFDENEPHGSPPPFDFPDTMEFEFGEDIDFFYVYEKIKSYRIECGNFGFLKKLKVTFNDEATSVPVMHLLLFSFKHVEILMFDFNNTTPIPLQLVSLGGTWNFRRLHVLKIRSNKYFTMDYLSPIPADNLMFFELSLDNNAHFLNNEQKRVWDFVISQTILMSVHLQWQNSYLFSWKGNERFLRMLKCYHHSELISKLFQGKALLKIREFALIDDAEKIVNFQEYYGHIFDKLADDNTCDCDLYVTITILKLIQIPIPCIYRLNIYIEEEENPYDFLKILEHVKLVCPNLEKMRFNHVSLVCSDSIDIINNAFDTMGSLRYYDFDKIFFPENMLKKRSQKRMRLE